MFEDYDKVKVLNSNKVITNGLPFRRSASPGFFGPARVVAQLSFKNDVYIIL
jgi:hypothetical protein